MNEEQAKAVARALALPRIKEQREAIRKREQVKIKLRIQRRYALIAFSSGAALSYLALFVGWPWAPNFFLGCAIGFTCYWLRRQFRS